MTDPVPSPIWPIRLDHLAVADETVDAALARYVGDLAGTWVSGGGTVGFSAQQIGFTGGMIEAITPVGVEEDDFLRRYLDRHGSGPHHLTYKTDLVSRTVPILESAGYRVINVRLDMPGLEEAFVHPHDAFGIVVQIQQVRSGGGVRPLLPSPRTAEPARLLHIAHAVPSLAAGLRLFRDTLGGVEVGRGVDSDGDWVGLRWEGDRILRLVEPGPGDSPSRRWLGDRPGRVLHVAFDTERPDEVPDAVDAGDGWYEVPPEANAGLRLRLRRSDGAATS